MGASVRIKAGDTERVQTPAVKDGSLSALTGLTTVVVAIQRTSDGFWFDFNDLTFKSTGWTTRQQQMTEVSATLAPGEYYWDFDTTPTTGIANPTADDTYMVRIDETGGTAKNVPFHGEIKVDQWVKDLFDEHDDTQTDIAVLQDLSAQDVRDAMKLAPTAGVPAAGSVDEHLDDILADTDSLDTTKITAARANNLDEITATRLAELDAANLPTDVANILSTGGAGPWTTAVGFATPTDVSNAQTAIIAEVDANEVKLDTIITTGGAGPWTSASAQDWTATEREQIRYRLAMDGTQTDPTTGTGTLEDILADTDSLDTTKLTTARANNLDNLDAAVSTRSSHTASDVNAALTAAHGSGAWTSADVSTLATSAEIASLEVHGDANWATATGFAVAGDAMTLTSGERSAVASATATSVWATALPGAFGTGTAGYLVGTYLDAAVSSIVGAGLTAAQATQLQELWFVHGLDNTKQLEVTPTTRKVPPDGSSIDQVIATVGSTVTVTRS